MNYSYSKAKRIISDWNSVVQLDLPVRVIRHLVDWVIVTVSWLLSQNLTHVVNRILKACDRFSFLSLLGIIWCSSKPADFLDTVVYGEENHPLK